MRDKATIEKISQLILSLPNPYEEGTDCDMWSKDMSEWLVKLFDQENLQDALTDVEEQALAKEEVRKHLVFFYQTHL